MRRTLGLDAQKLQEFLLAMALGDEVSPNARRKSAAWTPSAAKPSRRADARGRDDASSARYIRALPPRAVRATVRSRDRSAPPLTRGAGVAYRRCMRHGILDGRRGAGMPAVLISVL